MMRENLIATCSAWIAAIAFGMPGTALAEDWESRIFSAISLVKQNKDILPYPVETVIRSFSSKGVKRQVQCPPNHLVQSGEVEVHTEPLPWSHSVRIHNQHYQVPQSAAGYYVWAPNMAWQNGYKTAVVKNRILFNPNRDTKRNDRFEFDILRDLVLAYHELLHGQLMFDNMDTAAWISAFCQCGFPLDGSDPDHLRIYPILTDLVKTLVTGRDDWLGLEIAPEGGRHQFDSRMTVDTGLAATGVHVGVLVFEFSNIEGASLDLEIKRREVQVRGNRIDPTKPAYMVLGIQPQYPQL